MSAQVRYGNVLLENCTIDQFEQTPEREPSRVDQMFSRYSIAVSCVVTAGQWNASTAVGGRPFVLGLGSYDGLGPELSTPHDVVNYLRSALTADRRELAITIEGVVMLLVRPDNDADNGPKVKSFAVRNLSRESFVVSWSVEATALTCDSGGTNDQWPVISNRWSVADSIDNTNRTTRRWRGMLRLAQLPDPTKFLRTAHLYRHLAVPPLLNGWRIGAMNFTGEADGLTLGYEVVHEQLACEAAPFPAVAMNVQHVRSFELAGGATPLKANETITCELVGAALVDRLRLIYRAQSIVLQRANILASKDRILLRKFTISENVSQDLCSVGCALVAEHLGSGQTKEDGSLYNVEAGIYELGLMGQTLTIPDPPKGSDFAPYDPTRGIDFGPFGSGMGLLVSTLAAQWQTPCAPGHANIQGGLVGDPPKPSLPKDTTTPQTVPTWAPVKPPDLPAPVKLDDEAAEGIYTHARVQSEIATDHGFVVLPLAIPQEAPGSDPGSAPVSAVGIQLAGPLVVRTISAQFERVGKWPKLWRPKAFDDRLGVTHWPLPSRIVRQAPEKLADGATLYSVDATYRFGLSREYDEDEPTPTATLPWDDLKPEDTDAPPESWREPTDQEKGLC